ncbi:uncharacterized protein LOC130736160 [Lotus japonicus]|uniref:uncharacterized protein LOC130736160 n=1 Tax=Lotus japonicus TaxID=34305 RepID=UPI0025899332|nr:uncharacterized protein LOC130736160 [Lotus japonicus]
MSTCKKESVKGKIERTSGGARVMGLHTSSSAHSKKNSGTPSRKRYKSRAIPMQNAEAPVSEDISNSFVSANDEDDVTTSTHSSDATISDQPDKEGSLSKVSSPSSKNPDSKAEGSKEDLLVESMKTPPIVHDISDGEDSEEVPLACVADRLLKRRRASVGETPVSQKKKAKSTSVSSKSKPVDVQSKGKKKVVESSGKKVKKTTVKKKKVSRVELDSDSDVEADVLDITTSERKKFFGKRIPQDIPSIPLDNVSFHAAENAIKWKYVFQRRIAKEREIGSDVLACKEIVALITRAGLRKTVMEIGKCYDRLVKEFLVNLSDDVGNPASPEFRKVYVRGQCVSFSPAIINRALERSVVEFVEEELSLDTIAEELTGGKVTKWPAKKLLSTGHLTVKYVILNRIGVVNWIPSNHTSAVSAMLAKLIYRIGTHAETCAVKLPVSFPSLLTAIILQQHPHILGVNDVPFPKGNPITLDHRLFLEPHVLNIDLPSNRTSVPVYTSASGTKSVISELEDISKELQETIRVATARKLKVDALIQILKEEAGQEGEPAAAAEKEGSADNAEEHSSSDV